MRAFVVLPRVRTARNPGSPARQLADARNDQAAAAYSGLPQMQGGNAFQHPSAMQRCRRSDLARTAMPLPRHLLVLAAVTRLPTTVLVHTSIGKAGGFGHGFAIGRLGDRFVPAIVRSAGGNAAPAGSVLRAVTP